MGGSWEDMDDLRAELRSLQARLDALEAAGDGGAPPGDAVVDHTPAPPGPVDVPSDVAMEVGTDADTEPAPYGRRRLLQQAGAAAAGALVAGAAAATSVADPAAAADGFTMFVGSVETGTQTTGLTGSRFYVTDGNNLLSVAGVHSGATSTGVYGQCSGPNGRGVWGYSGAGGSTGVFASSAGTAVPLRLASTIPVIPPASGTFNAGSFLVVDGHLHYCYASGTGSASRWARLSTSLVPLPSPIRVYDSRAGFNPAVGTKGKYASGEERTVDTKYGGAVPAGATAVVVNLAATNTNPGGFFTAWRNGVAWPGTASINWGVAGTTVSNQVLVALDTNALFRTRMQGNGGADLIVDVVAYYT